MKKCHELRQERCGYFEQSDVTEYENITNQQFDDSLIYGGIQSESNMFLKKYKHLNVTIKDDGDSS